MSDESQNPDEKQSLVKFFVPRRFKGEWNRAAGKGGLIPWIIEHLNAAVNIGDTSHFEVIVKGNAPRLQGAGFDIELNCSIEEAEQFVDFMNMALNKADSDRMKGR